MIDDIIKTLSGVFPKEEGWEYFQNAKDLQRYCGIYFFKTNWKREGLERGIISYSLECDNIQFDDLYFSVVKGSDGYIVNAEKEQHLNNKVTGIMGDGEKGNWHPYYKHLDNKHRYINDALNNKAEFLEYVKDIFSKLKNDVTPLVDDIITTKSITMNK